MLPHKWNNYFPYGHIINCIHTVCFKLPCDDTNWDIYKLISTFPSLKVIIDLRSSSTCYDLNIIERCNIIYIKIPIKGQTIPSKSTINKFFSILDKYVELNYLIGVHCTHGVNRTGYMICKYLIHRLNILPNIAIDIFEYNRGYSIERKIYTDDIFNNYIGL
ncbi:protein tyrosine phosphatase 1 [Choristoneura rosaceana entomopoxvirus 'L']|uniref:Protein tyrosine phosphatase 1 n=1 Tax=Choristoneura rosaceana entomopoxvirus 'L' TaxID=1293539 RepID=A0ABM9QKS4_9POXV|nr:protein tyrosine phosphatase 1 [Choristoneura rosaceana entomopoxvirus 'L']CCU56151.1 protein tyrosine phosphatase 1 [Choristoneura rosaceana entomopoxvirus 'L']